MLSKKLCTYLLPYSINGWQASSKLFFKRLGLIWRSRNDRSTDKRVQTRNSLWEHEQSHTHSEILLWWKYIHDQMNRIYWKILDREIIENRSWYKSHLSFNTSKKRGEWFNTVNWLKIYLTWLYLIKNVRLI